MSMSEAPAPSAPPPIDLARLHRAMHRRIEHEESRTGLFAVVLGHAPRYLSLVDRLRADHREILRRIRALQHGANRDELRDLLATIRDHEELEREILRDALDG